MKTENFLVRKFSLIETLRHLPVGVPIEIPESEAKTSIVRKRASDLKKEGYSFTITERGMIGKAIVTRLK